MLRNRRKGEKNDEDKRNKIDKEIQSAFDRGISPFKTFKESN